MQQRGEGVIAQPKRGGHRRRDAARLRLSRRRRRVRGAAAFPTAPPCTANLPTLNLVQH